MWWNCLTSRDSKTWSLVLSLPARCFFFCLDQWCHSSLPAKSCSVLQVCLLFCTFGKRFYGFSFPLYLPCALVHLPVANLSPWPGISGVQWDLCCQQPVMVFETLPAHSNLVSALQLPLQLTGLFSLCCSMDSPWKQQIPVACFGTGLKWVMCWMQDASQLVFKRGELYRWPKAQEMAGEAVLPVSAALAETQKLAFIFVRLFSDVFPN